MSPSLTARQEECLRLTRLMTDREIAMHLGISEPTVKKHVQEACQRFGVNRRKAALALLENSEPQLQTVVNKPQTAPDDIRPRPFWRYRAPPRNPLFRVLLVGIIALLLAILVRAMTDVVFGYHGQVQEIDRALTPNGTPIAVPPVRS